jgi:hypothetical protein
MRYLFIAFITFISSSSNIGQANFFRVIEFDPEYNSPTDIYVDNNRFFSLVGHFCGALECSSLVEFSENGDTINRVVIPDIDEGFKAMIISNDTITIVGNNDPFNTHFRMAHFDFSGNKLGETLEILHPTKNYTNAFQLTAQKVNGKFHILGTGRADDLAHAIMYVAFPDGTLDTLVTIASDRKATSFDSDVDSENNLVTFNKIGDGGAFNDFISVVKYDTNYDTIWTYRTEKSINHLNSVRGVISENNIVFSTYTPLATGPRHSLRSIDENKNETIIYQPEQVVSNVRGFSRLKTLDNGDILGLGGFQDLSLSPPVHQAPWLIRMSPDGDIRWQRVFYELDPANNKARSGTLRDVVELANGDLYGVGDMKFDNITHSIVFKVDEDGCLTPDDCGIVQFVTESEVVDISDEIDLYPNPVSDRFIVSISDDLRDCSFMIIDEMGQTVRKIQPLESNVEVSVTEFSSGLYYLVVLRDGKMIGTRKVLVENGK